MKQSTIDSLTIAEAREIAALFAGNKTPTLDAETPTGHPFTLGGNYFIRTVTHHYTGKLVAVYPTELVLEKAAWIADDGRLTQAIAKAEFVEVEIYGDRQVIIGRGSLLDATLIESLPASQK